MKKNVLYLLLIIGVAVTLAACAGEDGSTGVAGVAGVAGDTGPPIGGDQREVIADGTYIGSAGCEGCHPTEYALFSVSGHGYKLNKVINDTMPQYPFSSIADGWPSDSSGNTDNTLGTPSTYADISYVIGGYNWKARWVDKDGYIVTGDAVQYNLADGSYSGYHADETDKPYNCGNCHTTGWMAYTDADGDTRNDNRQSDLDGMDGTFVAGGIQCEACHGGGAAHAESARINGPGAATQAAITLVATARTNADFLADDMAYGKAVTCGECHTRDGEHNYRGEYLSGYEAATSANAATKLGGRINAKGGLIRHHEQYDEVLGIDPDDAATGSTHSDAYKASKLNCSSCHAPHASTVYQDEVELYDGRSYWGQDGVDVACSTCHAEADTTQLYTGMANLKCTDCHMPKMIKNAIKTYSSEDEDNDPSLGDIKAHIFTIDLTANIADGTQYTADGKYAYPVVGADYACKGCHSTNGGHSVKTDAQLAVIDIHP